MTGGSPVYSWSDMCLQVTELLFDAAAEFFADYDPERAVLAWGVSGRTPQYHQAINNEFCLFTRSGFSQSLIEAAAESDDLRLFAIEDIVATF